MADNYCEPFEHCDDLDGRLLINRTMEGPPLAREEGELPLGSLAMQGGALHPYFHLFYEQRWITKEPCYGPVRSVMGLAPGETVTIEVRQREQTDFVRTVQTAFESSEVSTTTRRHGRELIDTDYEGNSVELWPIAWLKGSFLEDAWDVATAPVRAGVDLANDVIDGVQAGIDAIFGGDDGGAGGGGATGNTKTLDVIDETLETVQRSESQSSRTDTTTSRSVSVERSITRTFSNPYRDRSLELRFIPVFRRFEVVTYLRRVHHGILLHSGLLRFPQRGMGSAYGDFLQRRVTDPRIVSVANAELGLDDDVRSGARSSAVAEHLNANASLYTGRFLSHLEDQRAHGELSRPILRLLDTPGREPARDRRDQAGNLRAALAWSDLQVRGRTVYVPLTDPDNLVSALGGSEKARDLSKRLTRTILDPDWLARSVRRRDVHLFMGTKVEAVAGSCVLEDVPGVPVHDPGEPEAPPG